MTIFSQKIVLITGGGSGLGKGIAQEIALRGAVVVIADINLESAQKVASIITEKGGKSIAKYIDTTDYEQMKSLVNSTVEEFGRIDYFFNNAGIGISKPCHETSIDDWNKVLGVNLNGMVYGCELVYKLMVKQGFGHIVNTASLAALTPFPTAVPYATSKFAVLGMSRSLRIEGKFYGVKVSAICPGFVATNIYESAIRDLPAASLLATIPFKIVPLDTASQIIVDSVAKNKELIVFPFYAKLMWWFYRYCYPVASWIGKDTFRRYLDSAAKG